MQSKFQMISNALSIGVGVDRDPANANGGVTWRVTFLDDSPSIASQNFDLVLKDTNVYSSSNLVTPAITKLKDGVLYSSCVGTFVVPFDRALSPGQYYYSRVFAINDVGFSLPMVSPTPQKPMVIPGAPTSATLAVISTSELIVSFNPPSDDGGDAITKYMIEYSVNSDFSSSTSVFFDNTNGGAPFQKVISGLVKGTFYFVRVSAYNSQGYSRPTITTPSSMNPYSKSQGPTNVEVRSTSNSMITVSFNLPIDNGGDAITKYRVEWDVSINFNSLMSAPHKGQVDVDALKSTSYTIVNLAEGQEYYVRVFAYNNAGYGLPTLANPGAVTPQLQVPGKPHTLIVSTGPVQGQIGVSWRYPKVPWHGIPCSGLISAPDDCPTNVGGDLTISTGGAPILEYVVTYNEKMDFTGLDGGEATTSSTTFVLSNLVPSRTYYIRILARNMKGPGQYCSSTQPSCLSTTPIAFGVAKA